MDESRYAAMRAYIDLAVELGVEKKLTALRSALPTETREPVIGPAGKDGIATREELDALIEKRFSELQVRTFADVYQGVYKPGTVYTRGQIVTWGGSLWLSLVEARSKPGETPDWKLVVKK